MHRIRAVIFSLLLLCGSGFVSNAARAHDFEAADSGRTNSMDQFELALSLEPLESPGRMKLFSFIATQHLWPKAGKKLRVCFWDVDSSFDAMKTKISTLADMLVTNLPLSFQWKEGNQFIPCAGSLSGYDVRVSLKADPARLAPEDVATSFFAVIGRMGRLDSRKATVNLPFSLAASNDFVKSRVLHEFCHVLGCLHEYQQGRCDSSFDGEKIKEIEKLSEAQYEAKYLRIADSSMGAKAFSKFDPDSIMMYRFASWMFQGDPPASPCLRTTDVTKLSGDDERGLAAAYGPAADKSVPKSIEGFVTIANKLRDRSTMLRFKADMLRQNTSAVEFSALKKIASLETKANEVETELAGYDLKPETIAAVKRGIELLPR